MSTDDILTERLWRLEQRQKRERERERMHDEQIAQVCHEANRAYCKTIGDDSQPAWKDAPEWQRSSAIKGVEFIRENPQAAADASHNSWLAVKKAEGWTYGPVKDVERKEHPCFVPYEQLPLNQQAKDHLFGAVVRALLATHTTE